MGQAIGSDSREIQLSTLNAKAEALSMRDASAWDEAIDWGVPDYRTLCLFRGCDECNLEQ